MFPYAVVRFLVFSGLAAVVFCLPVTAVAQELRGNVTGKVESDGTIRNSSNAQVGKIDSSGVVRDRNGAQIGKIESEGTIRDRSGSQVGKIDSSGIVRDRSNAQIGKIESDGTVRDRNNSSIGTARGVKPAHAAAMFFFLPILK